MFKKNKIVKRIKSFQTTNFKKSNNVIRRNNRLSSPECL